MKELLADKYNLRYFIPIVIFCLIVISFLLSGWIKTATTPTITTQIGRSFKSEKTSDKISFKTATYYEKSNLLVTTYFIESDEIVPNDNLEVISYDGKTGEKISSQTERVNANYYVVFTPNVTNNFNQIVNNLNMISTSNEKEEYGSVALTQKNIKRISSTYEAKPLSFYNDQYKDYAITSLEKQNKTFDNQLKKYDENIKAINLENKQLLDALDYKTDEQQESIQQEIDSNNSEITSIEVQKDDVKKQQAKLVEQMNLLSEEA